MRTTTITKPAETTKAWYVVDAENKTLGRLASEVAKILRGKHKPIFQPHMDCGDYVIIVNAGKIKLTGNKINQKTYFRHSGWVGGDKVTSIKMMLQKKPTEVVRHAVLGMLPKNTLGRAVGKKLFVYNEPTHPHEAQKPQVLEIKADVRDR